MDLALNLLIVGLTLALILGFWRKDGQWQTGRVRKAFRFFTVQSNALCAGAALAMCLAPEAPWAWLLKYLGTAAVTVTMLTVLLFLGPTSGYKALFQGADLFMHLVTPILALVSFCGFERRGLSLPLSLLGLLPVALYALLYGWKVLLAPPDRGWEDFYGFNRGGRWYVSAAAVLLGNLLICLGLAALQNL